MGMVNDKICRDLIRTRGVVLSSGGLTGLPLARAGWVHMQRSLPSVSPRCWGEGPHTRPAGVLRRFSLHSASARGWVEDLARRRCTQEALPPFSIVLSLNGGTGLCGCRPGACRGPFPQCLMLRGTSAHAPSWHTHRRGLGLVAQGQWTPGSPGVTSPDGHNPRR